MAAIVPLTVARINFLAVRADQTLLAADSGGIGELWAFWIACIGKMGLISGGHITLPISVKLGVAVTALGVLEGDICAAVWTCERGAGGVGVGWCWRSWTLLKRLWSYSTGRPLAVHNRWWWWWRRRLKSG